MAENGNDAVPFGLAKVEMSKVGNNGFDCYAALLSQYLCFSNPTAELSTAVTS